MTKNEYYVNIKNQGHIIHNDMLINKINCIKLKSVIPENINSFKNIKNDLYNVKKDTDSLSIDLKNLKEEYIIKSNKKVKVQSTLINIKVNRFNKRFNQFNMRFNRFFNKPSSKTNACTIKDSAIVKIHVDVYTLIVDACTSTEDHIVKKYLHAYTSTDDHIVKKYVDACTSTDDLIVKKHVDACTSTDDHIVKKYVDACTSTDIFVKNNVDVCTSTDDLIVKNQVDTCTSNDDLIVKNHVDACTSTDDVCTNENKQFTNENDDDDSDDKRGDNGNNDNKPGNNCNNDNTKVQVNNSKVLVNEDNTKVQVKKDKNKSQVNNDKLIMKKNKVVDQFNLIANITSDYLNNINKISEIMNGLHDDPQLRHIELNKINVLTNKSLDFASELCHGGNREWYDRNDNINTINDKIDLVNEIGEVIDSFMTDAYNIIDSFNKSENNDSLYDILEEDLKKCKDTILKMINSFNRCVKQDTKKNDNDNVNVCEKQDTNKNEASINENDDDDNVNKDFSNLSDKAINNLNIIGEIRKEILINNTEIIELINKAENSDDSLLKLDKFKKLNKLCDNLLNHIWKIA